MPRIRCRYIDCIYLEDGYCITDNVALDPDEGCLTYTRLGEVPDEDAWEDDDLENVWDDDDVDYLDDVEDDDWDEDDEY